MLAFASSKQKKPNLLGSGYGTTGTAQSNYGKHFALFYY